MQTLLFLTALAAGSAVDCRRRTIPDSLCLLTAAAGLISFSPASFLECWRPALLIAALIQPECMGGGDIKLTAAAGFVLGFWRGFWGLALGLLLAVLYFCTAIVISKKFIHHPLPAMTRAALPLGPIFIHRLCRTILFWRLTAMKKFHVTRKTVLTIVGVTLPLTAAAILLPRLKRSRRARFGPGVMPGLSDPT